MDNIMKDKSYTQALSKLADALQKADAVVIGAGAGLSTAAGLTYDGARFDQLFGDYKHKYGLTDMYSAGFYPFPTPEEQWAYWSRFIWCNRYEDAPKTTYNKLLQLVANKDFFVITTNVDHKFQQAGFPKNRLFYTQGDYGLWQCSEPCHAKTYDNYETVCRMVKEQRNMRVPSELVPTCPVCGKPMSMNLRADNTFVEDEGWHKAAQRYSTFVERHYDGKVLYLELGVGENTPSIIKYPFWRYTNSNPQATYACVNFGAAYTHPQIARQSITLNADIDLVLDDLLACSARGDGNEATC